MENSNELDLHGLMSQLGEFSSYQKRQHFLHGLAWLLAGVHMMGFVFVFPEMDHRCYVEEVDGYHYANINISNEMQMYIPRNKEGKFESCLKFDHFNGSVISCDKGYVYSSAHYPSSRIADWNLVCGKSYFKALLQSIFMMGTLVGSFACGYFADKLGRKPVFCVSGILQLLCGIGVAFLNEHISFSIVMFFYGLFGSAGAVVSSIALTMELVGPSKRNTCGTFFTILFGVGAIIVAAWAYFLRVQANILQLIFASHSLLLFGHFWFMDESICWLWSKGRKEEAFGILTKAMKCNGKEPNISLQQIGIPNPHSEQKDDEHCNNNSDITVATPENDTSADEAKTCNLFCYPKLRQRTLVMIFCWFASCLTYLGLSFNSVNLLGNPYAMFIVTILAEIPGHFISIFGTRKTGNKLMFGISLLTTGCLCVVVPLLPQGWLTIILTLTAKVSATVSFDVINSYTAELFPTNLRNTAIGFCMMSARSGGALVPIINLSAATAEGIPLITFGATGIVAGVLTLFLLPETMNKEIPQTIKDVEKTNKTTENS